MYEPITGTDKWGLVLYNLDGSHKRVLVLSGNWGALSPDGSKVAYSATDNGIHIVDADSQTDKVLPGVSGFNLHWSPDGKQIAYIGSEGSNKDSLYLVNADGTRTHQVSDLSYESVVGWSPDGKLYFRCALHGRLLLGRFTLMTWLQVQPRSASP